MFICSENSILYFTHAFSLIDIIMHFQEVNYVQMEKGNKKWASFFMVYMIEWLKLYLSGSINLDKLCVDPFGSSRHVCLTANFLVIFAG